MKELKLRFNKCKLTLAWEYTDSCEEGFTTDSEDDLVLGFGKFTIPAEHRTPLFETFSEGYLRGMGMDIENEWPEGQNCETENSDIFILWMNWVINNLKEYRLEMKSEHIFWPVHDLFHTKHDVDGEFYCGIEEELQRYRQAYAALRRRHVKVEKDYLDRITHAFNTRKFGCDYSRQRECLRRVHITSPRFITEHIL